MALTLNETDVKIDATFTPMLKDLQGNILKHHGRTHAFHLFFLIKPGKVEAAKTWLKKFASTKITSAFKQLEDTDKHHQNGAFDGGIVYTASLSKAGYSKLGFDNTTIPDSPSYRKGMRSQKTVLADSPANWETGFKKNIDGLVILADDQVSRLTAEKNAVAAEINTFATIVVSQKGKILRNEHGTGIEHFGYADGVSQPNYLAARPTQPGAPAPVPPTQWNDNQAPLKNVLVKDKGGKTADSYGSYFVFRKLEQNVAAFKMKEQEISARFNGGAGIKDNNGNPNDELAGAMMVGRFEDGTETVNQSTEKGINNTTVKLNNDFDYRNDTAASKCPFHAHIRITNPRADVGADQVFAKKVRITRRGIPFNDIGRDEFDLEKDQPNGGVGLLFMCYNSRLEEQFEFLQSSWANQGNIGGHLVGQDPIIGQGANTTDRTLPSQWGTTNGLESVKDFKDFVENKGGEYFFTPSISFLKSLTTV
ncbi:Dyp-type peroxidase [Spirosoma gilvum]